mmetsp:Transcript_35498/g.68307  ORF Transcript_35498/g.68307 Transcript_35498/m.68307 type:complete len:220 (-) Transcript_35498:2076-2735(-)
MAACRLASSGAPVRRRPRRSRRRERCSQTIACLLALLGRRVAILRQRLPVLGGLLARPQAGKLGEGAARRRGERGERAGGAAHEGVVAAAHRMALEAAASLVKAPARLQVRCEPQMALEPERGVRLLVVLCQLEWRAPLGIGGVQIAAQGRQRAQDVQVAVHGGAVRRRLPVDAHCGLRVGAVRHEQMEHLHKARLCGAVDRRDAHVIRPPVDLGPAFW